MTMIDVPISPPDPSNARIDAIAVARPARDRAIEAYGAGYRYVKWAFVLHRLKPNGITACGIPVPQWCGYDLDDDEQGPYFCKRCAERVHCIDPISGTDYEHGDCENCGVHSEQLLLTNVESGGCTDRLQLCPTCRTPRWH